MILAKCCDFFQGQKVNKSKICKTVDRCYVNNCLSSYMYENTYEYIWKYT